MADSANRTNFKVHQDTNNDTDNDFCFENASLSLVGNSGRLDSSRKSNATHSHRRVQYFRVSKQWYGCQCWGFSRCAQILTHAIAHGGCRDTVRKSALEADSGRKIPCCTWDSNPHQYNCCARLFSRTLYQLMLLKCCFTSTETVGLLGTGAQDGHLDFHTAPELWYQLNYSAPLNLGKTYRTNLMTKCGHRFASPKLT